MLPHDGAGRLVYPDRAAAEECAEGRPELWMVRRDTAQHRTECLADSIPRLLVRVRIRTQATAQSTICGEPVVQGLNLLFQLKHPLRVAPIQSRGTLGELCRTVGTIGAFRARIITR